MDHPLLHRRADIEARTRIVKGEVIDTTTTTTTSTIAAGSWVAGGGIGVVETREAAAAAAAKARVESIAALLREGRRGERGYLYRREEVSFRMGGP